MARLLGQVPELEPASINDIVRVVARALLTEAANISNTLYVGVY